MRSFHFQKPISQKRYVPSSEPVNVTLFGKKKKWGVLQEVRFGDLQEVKSSLLNYPAKSWIPMPGLLTMDKREDRGEDGDRDWTDVAKSQRSHGMPTSIKS